MKLSGDASILDYFDRVSIIHLKERSDRYCALVRELRRMSIEITHPKIRIPDAIKPSDANGFPTKGVYGNFLSHLEILKSALQENLQSVWVLEDDAIFSRLFMRKQDQIADFLARSQWDICYFGHTLTQELNSLEIGLPRYSGPFYWAHCYAVNGRVLPRLISYLEETVDRPCGHPQGAKMYIDAAHTLFRRFNPDVVTLVSNPVLSVQRGSPSSLGRGHWYDQHPLARPMVQLARNIRDEWWRWSG
jgi:GR25 family glycosyltransferase involved in LPS biosynthesis